jgi:hypothetical protein
MERMQVQHVLDAQNHKVFFEFGEWLEHFFCN